MTPPPRSWLFVPADSEKKIAKALVGDADAVILDLEDSVAASRKKEAREIAGRVLSQAGERPQRWVRINPLDSGFAEDDLACAAGLPIAGLVLPKAQSGADVARLSVMPGAEGFRIHAIVTETAASLFGLMSYADPLSQLAAMSWGAEDLSAALGASSKYGADGGLSFTYCMARSLCLAGAVAAGVQPIDGVFADFRDAEGLRAEAEAARREGFTGKLAIHPDQVSVINAAFTPSEAEIAAARRIVDAFAAAPDAGTIALDGRMLDRPHLLAAARLLAFVR